MLLTAESVDFHNMSLYNKTDIVKFTILFVEKWNGIMYKRKTEKEIRCPLEYGLDVFGGKWKSRIICLLDEYKVMRYSQIRSELNNVTDTVLSATLKELMHDNIVLREQYNEIPQRVEYSLTDKGRSAIPILRSICRWSGTYHYEEYQQSLAQCKSCMACHKVLDIRTKQEAKAE